MFPQSCKSEFSHYQQQQQQVINTFDQTEEQEPLEQDDLSSSAPLESNANPSGSTEQDCYSLSEEDIKQILHYILNIKKRDIWKQPEVSQCNFKY